MSMWTPKDSEENQQPRLDIHGQGTQSELQQKPNFRQRALGILMSFVLAIAMIPSVGLEHAYATDETDTETGVQQDAADADDDEEAAAANDEASATDEDPVYADNEDATVDEGAADSDDNAQGDIALLADDSTDDDDDNGTVEKPAKVTNLKLTVSSTTSVKVSWNKVDGAEGYKVEYGSKSTEVSTNSATLSVSKNQLIEVKVTAYNYKDTAKTEKQYGETVSAKCYTGKVSSLSSTVSKSNKQIKLTWSKPSGASSYKVKYRKAGGSWTTKTTSKTSYTLTSLKANTAYEVQVIPVDSSCDGVSSSVYRFVGKASVSTSLSSTSKVKASWKKVSGASGYEMSYITGSGSTWKSGYTGSKTSKSISVSSKKALAVKVRPYYKSGGKTYTGQWSSVAYRYAAKISSLSATVKTSKKTIKVGWNKVSGATSYKLQYRAKGGSWKTVKVSKSKKSYTIKKLKNGKAYQVRVYPVFNTKINGSKHSCLGKSKTAYRLMSSTTPSIKRSGTTMKITLSKAKKASGYQVKYSKKSSLASAKTKTSSSRTLSLKGLGKKTTYYVKARPYYKSGGKTYYGPWSSKTKSVGVTSAQTKMVNKAQSYSSNTSWLILVNCSTHKVGIFKGSKGNWSLKKYFSCTTGKPSTPTKKGVFSVGNRGTSFGSSTYTCWYWTQWSGNYLFHSILYMPGSKSRVNDGRLGMSLSHGCVRLAISNAKWIYNNIPRGTKVVVY